jgi:hypothetical protein
MKYSEFLQLSEILDKKGLNISDIKSSDKDITIKLFEADDVQPTQTKDIETEKVGKAVVTRWGRMKLKLNKVGKDTQKQLQEKVLNKYFPQILNSEKQLAEKVKANKEQDVRKLQKLVVSNHKAIQAQQEKQMQIINKSMEEFLGNISQKMNNKIDASKVSDKNKLRLKNYWLLLTTQISMNASIYMNNQREKIIDEIFAGNKKASEEVKKITNAGGRKAKQDKTTKVEKLKTQTLADTKAAEAEEKGNTETQPTEQKPAAPATKEYEVGKKYEFTQTNGKPGFLTIVKQDGDQFTLKTDAGKAEFTRSKNWMNKNIK